MGIRENIEAVKAKYRKLAREGVGDPSALKTEVQKLLREAKLEGVPGVDEELEEILIDLSFLTEETKCKCHTARCRC